MGQDTKPGIGWVGARGYALRGAVALVAFLAFVPVADLIPGDPGSTMPPPVWSLLVLWVIGTGVIGLLARVGARLIPARRKPHAPPGEDRTGPRGRAWMRLAFLVALPALLYSLVGQEVFSGAPLHVDSATQAFQGQLFARGHLSAPAPEPPGFFSSFLIVEFQGRTFAHFPPGWAALLALGLLLGVPWLMAPLCGALAGWGLFRLLRENGETEAGALYAVLLFALAPWVVFNAASWMNHIPAVCFIVLGSAALLRGIRSPGSRLWPALGAAWLGMATLIRPMDGVAFGIPATVWMVACALRDRSARRSLVAFALGGIATVGLQFAYNWVQHGSPLTLGFEAQWGAGHGLGFHEAPWGPTHTVLRGIELLNGYLLAMQMLFFDSPAPSLFPALAALLLARRLGPLDRYLLAGSALVLLGYLSYWGEGHYLGPRYLLPLAPVVAIWTARFGSVLGEWTGRDSSRRWGHAFVVLLVAGGWLFGTPERWAYYRQLYPLRRLDTVALTTSRAARAVVFVPAAWSSQVEARLWGAGVPRLQAQWLTDRISLCRLELAVTAQEERGITDPDQMVAQLLPLAADSASMVRDPLTGAPGDPYAGMSPAELEGAELCRRRQALEQEHTGFLLDPLFARLGPTWTGAGAIVARDLQERNRGLLDAHADREAFYLRRLRGGGSLRQVGLEPLRGDSAQAVWTRLDSLRAELRRRPVPGAGGP